MPDFAESLHMFVHMFLHVGKAVCESFVVYAYVCEYLFLCGMCVLVPLGELASV